MRCYLVCYDIRDDKRLRRVFHILKGYGKHWQFSIFFCTLKSIERVRLQSDLEAAMNLEQDQALIIDLGPDEEKARQAATVIGQSLPPQDSRIVVV